MEAGRATGIRRDLRGERSEKKFPVLILAEKGRKSIFVVAPLKQPYHLQLLAAMVGEEGVETGLSQSQVDDAKPTLRGSAPGSPSGGEEHGSAT